MSDFLIPKLKKNKLIKQIVIETENEIHNGRSLLCTPTMADLKTVQIIAYTRIRDIIKR
jgi:hypothetical protein